TCVLCTLLRMILVFADAVCDHESLTGIPVMLLANKQDIEVRAVLRLPCCIHDCVLAYCNLCDLLSPSEQGALSSEELYSNLHPIADAASRSKVFSVSALTG